MSVRAIVSSGSVGACIPSKCTQWCAYECTRLCAAHVGTNPDVATMHALRWDGRTLLPGCFPNLVASYSMCLDACMGSKWMRQCLSVSDTSVLCALYTAQNGTNVSVLTPCMHSNKIGTLAQSVQVAMRA